MPVFRSVQAALTDRLARGIWKPGEALPSEARLKAEFGVAIGTIRKAVDALVAQNILVRQQGRGTFVTIHNRDRQLFHFFHIERQDGYKEYPAVELLDFARMRLLREAASRLNCYEGARAFRFRNTLALEGNLVVLDDITVPEALFPRLTEKKLVTRPGTLYSLYQEAYGLSVVHTAQRLSSGIAPRDVAQAMGWPTGLPVLIIRRVAFAYHDQPIEYRISYVDTRRHEYVSDTMKFI